MGGVIKRWKPWRFDSSTVFVKARAIEISSLLRACACACLHMWGRYAYSRACVCNWMQVCVRTRCASVCVCVSDCTWVRVLVCERACVLCVFDLGVGELSDWVEKQIAYRKYMSKLCGDVFPTSCSLCFSLFIIFNASRCLCLFIHPYLLLSHSFVFHVLFSYFFLVSLLNRWLATWRAQS